MKSYASKTKAVAGFAAHDDEPELDLQTSLVAPPERATLPLKVTVQHKSFSDASRELRVANERLAGLLGPHAALVVVDYQTPDLQGEFWLGACTLRVDVELAGLDTVGARMDRVDAALGGLYEFLARQPAIRKKWSPKSCAAFNAGSLRPELRDLEPLRKRLLADLAERLDALVGVSKSPQWSPERLRCLSTGLVRVETRRLSGVRVTLDLRYEPDLT